MTQTTIPMKHRVSISVCNGRGHREPVLHSSKAQIPKRLLRWLFGGYSEILVLTPGKTVCAVEIHEVPMEVDDASV